jgi:hypothetical protein
MDWFPPQHNEILRALHHKSSELCTENALDLVGLLYSDADTDRVDGRLDQDAFVFVAGNRQGVQEDFLGPSTKEANS